MLFILIYNNLKLLLQNESEKYKLICNLSVFLIYLWAYNFFFYVNFLTSYDVVTSPDVIIKRDEREREITTVPKDWNKGLRDVLYFFSSRYPPVPQNGTGAGSNIDNIKSKSSQFFFCDLSLGYVNSWLVRNDSFRPLV